MKTKNILLVIIVSYLGITSLSFAALTPVAVVKKNLKAVNISIRILDINEEEDVFQYSDLQNINESHAKCIDKQLAEVDKFKKMINDKDPLKDLLSKSPEIKFDFYASSAFPFNKPDSSSTDKSIVFNFSNLTAGCQLVEAKTLYSKFNKFYKINTKPEIDLNAAVTNLTKPAAKRDISCNDGSRNAKPREVEGSRSTASSANVGR